MLKTEIFNLVNISCNPIINVEVCKLRASTLPAVSSLYYIFLKRLTNGKCLIFIIHSFYKKKKNVSSFDWICKTEQGLGFFLKVTSFLLFYFARVHGPIGPARRTTKQRSKGASRHICCLIKMIKTVQRARTLDITT